jgi:hypothetical protein
MNEAILMAHVFFGVLCLLAGVWVFVDTLNASAVNLARIRRLSLGIAIAMWLAYLIAGYWYVVFYGADKAVILKGPWPFAHNFFMETKEHIVIVILLLATYLPLVAANDLGKNRDARRLMLWSSAIFAVLTFAAEGMGAMIAMGVKVGLLAK